MLDPRVVENQLYRARMARIDAEEAVEDLEEMLGRVRRSWSRIGSAQIAVPAPSGPGPAIALAA